MTGPHERTGQGGIFTSKSLMRARGLSRPKGGSLFPRGETHLPEANL